MKIYVLKIFVCYQSVGILSQVDMVFEYIWRTCAFRLIPDGIGSGKP